MGKTLYHFEFGRALSISADAKLFGGMVQSIVSVVCTESFSKMRTQLLEQGYVENYTGFYDDIIDRYFTFCFHSNLPSMNRFLFKAIHREGKSHELAVSVEAAGIYSGICLNWSRSSGASDDIVWVGLQKRDSQHGKLGRDTMALQMAMLSLPGFMCQNDRQPTGTKPHIFSSRNSSFWRTTMFGLMSFRSILLRAYSGSRKSMVGRLPNAILESLFALISDARGPTKGRP